MSKIFIEDTEISIREKSTVQEEQHSIDGKKYTNRTIISKEFESSIYAYEEVEKVLISKIPRFGSEFYKIVLFNDESQKAWNTIELSCELEIRVKRMGKDNFVIIADGKGSQTILSQVSFCRLKPSTKVEEITINFTKLNEVRFIDSGGTDYVLLSYSDVRDNMTYHTLALYNAEGKCEQLLYEYPEDGKLLYRYEVIAGNKVKIFKEELTKARQSSPKPKAAPAKKPTASARAPTGSQKAPAAPAKPKTATATAATRAGPAKAKKNS